MKKNIKKSSNTKRELYIKILILIILIILLILTSFNTGRKFYLFANTFFDDTKGIINSDVARWNFNARVIMEKEVIVDE